MVDRYPFEGNLTRLLRNVSDKFSTTSSDFQNSYNNSPKITENWNSYGNNSTGINVNLVENYTSLNVQDYLGPQRNKFFIVICLTIIYTTIFVTGLMGNLFTCIVILKNFYMRTVTNYYLASLALADLLTLTFGKLKQDHVLCIISYLMFYTILALLFSFILWKTLETRN